MPRLKNLVIDMRRQKNHLLLKFWALAPGAAMARVRRDFAEVIHGLIHRFWGYFFNTIRRLFLDFHETFCGQALSFINCVSKEKPAILGG